MTATPAAAASTLGARLVLAFGSLVFMHAAYSAYEFVSVQKALGLTGTQAVGLPFDIKAETLAGLGIVVLGLVMTASPMRDITWASEYRRKTIDQIDARPSFITLNHRGPHLFGSDE